MRRFAATLLGLLLLNPVPAPAQDTPEIRATYEIYAAGLHVAEVSAAFKLGSTRYAIRLSYHTTGVLSWFRQGHQVNSVAGTWDGGQPRPEQFRGAGIWQGAPNATLIDYTHGQPVIERLLSPPGDKREPIPPGLEANSIDSLSALALLIRRVQDSGRCGASAHTFDGRRVSNISARTAGEDMLGRSDLAIFTGSALRCDFVGQMVAGFLYRDNAPADHRPLQGSAWLASLVPDGPPIPVRMDFQTRWFGEAHMYLTRLQTAPATEVAAQH
ncbi:MAG TPA: DUF3108 domain-containing protein [Acetobacteraceae bacterium]|jgi:hypothetical protein|nr:DUF3108 domain-containing protein [Acetobacteraceae bacterium]